MKLLNNKFKSVGWIILIIAIPLAFLALFMGVEFEFLNTTVISIFPSEILGHKQYFSWLETNITLTIIGLLFIIGALLVGFSKEKVEDEFIFKLRLTSLMWAVLVNYLLLILLFIFVYETAFFSVLLFNLFTTIIIYIALFNFNIFKNKKELQFEK